MNRAVLYKLEQSRGPETLVDRYGELVHRIARHLTGRLPEGVPVDDLIQAGMIGLLEAWRNYDERHGASFETYAGIRIRGAMLDEVRRNDWLPRSAHRKAREVSSAIKQVENREGRGARGQEIAAALGVTLDEYHQLLQDASGHRLFSMDALDAEGDAYVEQLPADEPGPCDALQHRDVQERLAQLIAQLPERERLVMGLYYERELNLREIGQVLGVSESRVCQIHGQALARIKARMGPGA